MSGLRRSDDTLPANTIRFSEAFELFYRTIEWWEEIEARVAEAIAKHKEDPSELVELPRLLGQGPITEHHRLAIIRSEAIAARETARADAWGAGERSWWRAGSRHAFAIPALASFCLWTREDGRVGRA
jgi:hypothetical protein